MYQVGCIGAWKGNVNRVTLHEQLPSMRSIILVVESVAEPNRRYPSLFSSRAEHHPCNTYETVKLCKRLIMGEVEGPIEL